MLCFRSRNPSLSLLFLTLFLFASSTFALSNLHIPSDLHEALTEKEYGGRSLLETWRFLKEETVDNSSLILAEKRTHRKDFFDNLNYYKGGWNISNSHYWSSVVSTGIPFFGFAAAWCVLFGLCLCFICLHHCCCLREPYGYSRTAYALSLIFLILFTIAAIVGCIVLYIGQGKFHSSTSNTLGYVVDQANTTAKKLNDVSGFLNAAKGIGVESVILSPNFQKDIDNIEAKIKSSAAFLSKQTGDNAENIQNGLDGMRLALIILAAVMLFLAFIGFLFSIFGMQCLVYTLVIFGWILVTGTFILCGVFLLLHNVVADTCVAMDEWVLNPTAHTALDDILPCVDNATAQETLLKTKDVTYRLVDGVNSVISGFANVNVPPNAGAIYYNQSGPLMPLLCNPFHSNLTDRQCAAGEVPLSNASQVYKNYICEVSASDICTTPGRITPNMNTKMEAAVNVSYGLYRYGPFLTELQDCTFVRDTFTSISKEYCPGLGKYTQWIYTGLVMVSAAVMLSLIFWVIYARERRHRVYTKRFIARSSDAEGKYP